MIIDISWPISLSMTQYKNRNDIKIVQTKELEKDHVRSSIITLGSHTGTHVDAPSHFLQNGNTIDQFSLEQLCGPCEVLDFTHIKQKITKNDLQNISFNSDTIYLFKTKNSASNFDALFDFEFIYIDATAAQFLAEKNIKAVGIDYLGVERNQPHHETHIFFLEKNIPIIEGLRLQDVDSGEYQFYCLPLAVKDLEAVPARAILVK